MRKTLSAVALALGLAFTSGTAAHATMEYPAPEQNVVISAARVEAGGTITVSGTGLEANEEATITVAQNQSRKNFKGFTVDTTADASGAFAADVTFQKPGRHWVTVEGEETGKIGAASVVVTGNSSGDDRDDRDRDDRDRDDRDRDHRDRDDRDRGDHDDRDHGDRDRSPWSAAHPAAEWGIGQAGLLMIWWTGQQAA
jgi:hypothetical protein